MSITAAGVTIDGFTVTRSGNTVADWGANAQSYGISIDAVAGVTIQNNKVTGNRNGVYVGQSSHNAIIRRNIIDFNRTGVHIVDNNNSLVEENFITNNWTMGILYRTEGGPAATVHTVRNNNISGNWYSQIENRDTPGTAVFNASGNYLGTTNPTRVTTTSLEEGYATQIPVLYGGTDVAPASPTATIAGPQSARLDYSPFLNVGTDTQPGTPGFQGDFANLTVNSDSPQANGVAGNIQEGINMALAGGSVTALAGTYAGNVDVNKAVTLKGTPTISGSLTASVAGAVISPGFSPGMINSGNLSLSSGSIVSIQLDGLTAGSGHDQLNVTGTVNLGGATLNVTTGFAVGTGNSFVIINNDGGDAVVGTFAGLSQGATFVVSGTTFTISYIGGSGNDVVLTATVAACNNVSIPTNIQTLPSQQVSVPINIDDTTGRGILSYTYSVTYNQAVLSYIGIDQAGTLSSTWSFTVNSTVPGVLTINLYGNTPLTGAGVMNYIRFQTVGGIGTSSTLNFTSFELNEGVPCVNTSNGLVTVISSTISGVVSYGNSPGFVPVPHTVLNAVGSVNQSTTSAVVTGAYSLSGLGSGAYTVTPSKTGDVNGITGLDASRISQHVVGLITLNASQLAAADVSNNGSVSGLDASYISQWVVNIPNPSITGTWKFVPANRSYANLNTPQVNQDYVGILMGEVTGNWVAPLSRPERSIRPIKEENATKVELPSMKAGSGTEVTVPIDIRDLTDRSVTAYQFDIEFDADVLEPMAVAADLSRTISEGMTVASNSPRRGLLRVVVYGVDPIKGRGTLVNLRFSAIGPVGTSSPLTVNGFMLNEGNTDVLVKDGAVTIVEARGSSIRGRLLSATGERFGQIRVSIRSTAGEVRTVLSNASGEFEFDELTFGETYVVTVDSRRLGFKPQAISVIDTRVNVDMIAKQ